MGRYLGMASAMLTAAALAGCQPAAPPANSTPAAPPTNTAATSTPPAPIADAADAAAAKTYLEGLYAHYKTSKDSTFELYAVDGRGPFDPDLVALLKADQKALKGDEGVLESDLLCDCQDFESLHATIAVQSATPTTARATSDFQDSGIADAKPGHDSFDLVKVGQVWRIDDIHTADMPSLRKALNDEIRSLGSGGNAAAN